MNWTAVSPYVKTSSFAAQYAQVRNLALRAIPWKELFDPVLPGIFIGWARRLDINFPKELEEKVIARGGKVADWKASYDAAKKQYDDLNETYEKQRKLLNDFSALTDKQSDKIKSLNAQIEALNIKLQAVQNTPQKGKDLKTRERDTLLKMIIAMAVGKYSYDPSAVKSGGVTKIMDALDRAGLKMSDDTVRGKLQEAERYLSPDYFEE